MYKITTRATALLLLAFLAFSGLSGCESIPSEGDTAETDTAAESDATNPLATITMADGGVITVELYPDMAPNTVTNFIALANSGFYDGLAFQRVIKGFMIQGGDPNGDNTGGPGYHIAGEFSANGFEENTLLHTRGVISMARSNQSYDSAGCQFFIMVGKSANLDGYYAAFGKVTDGMDIADAIAAQKTDNNDKPLTEQTIETIRVETYGVDYGEPEIID